VLAIIVRRERLVNRLNPLANSFCDLAARQATYIRYRYSEY